MESGIIDYSIRDQIIKKMIAKSTDLEINEKELILNN